MNSIWWLGLIFFFDLFSHSGLRAFFTDDFANCTTVYAQPSGAVHSIWWLGLFLFDLFSHSGLRAFLHKWFCQLYYKLSPQKITPTIRCCEQHLMVGVFFLTCSPILDLGHFSQVILPIVLQIMPHPSGAGNSIWWLGFFLTCSPILDLGHFSQVILPIVLLIMPQLSGAVHSIWWLGLFFFWPVLPFWT